MNDSLSFYLSRYAPFVSDSLQISPAKGPLKADIEADIFADS